jgi:hypothetical protein
MLNKLLKSFKQGFVNRNTENNLERFHQRPAAIIGVGLKPIRAVAAEPLFFTLFTKSYWGLEECILRSEREAVARYWFQDSTRLVEVETIEGRWLATGTPSQLGSLHNASVEPPGFSTATLTGNRLEFPTGQFFEWKLERKLPQSLFPPTLSYEEQWDWKDGSGHRLMSFNFGFSHTSRKHNLVMEPPAVTMPELTLLVLFGGYLSLHELNRAISENAGGE